MSFHIEHVSDNQFLLANHFLKQQKQPTAGREDQLFAAFDQQKVIAAAWLRKIENSHWLRSLIVSAEYRHQQLGSQLLHKIQKTPGLVKIVAFAHPNLSVFYHRNHFQTITPTELNTTLAETFKNYRLHQLLEVFQFDIVQ